MYFLRANGVISRAVGRRRGACRPRRAVLLCALVTASCANVAVAFAQQTVPAGGAAGAGGGGSSAGGGASPTGGGSSGGVAPGGGAAASQAPPTVTFFPGGIAPTPPGQVLGGGNVTSSSSRPILGNESDTFDLGSHGGSTGTAFGAENGPVFLGEGRPGGETVTLGRGGQVPGVHTVRKGDTLWDICDQYFENPYQWPRIWSFNPQLQNPHWIYPGNQIRLRSNGIAFNDAGTSAGNAAPKASSPNAGSSLIDKRRQVPNDTLFLRDEGFIEDSSDENWGEISGAPVDRMFLSDLDEIYLRVGGTRDVKLGQELAIFRPVRSVQGGKLVQIQGTVRVDQWNAKERVARGQIVETLDVIERGARIGPIGRKFVVTPPVRNETEVRARVLASIYPHTLYGQNQVIFVDKGEKDGLRPGNRLFIVRKGDAWKGSLTTSSSATRIALESDSPAEVERVPTPRNANVLPEEVVGELRVVAVRDHTATCVVSQSRGEIELQDQAIARKGY